MALTFASDTRPLSFSHWNVSLPSLLLLVVSLAGCHNTCFTFTSNPPTGSLTVKAGNPAPTCTLTRANAIVRVAMHAAPACSSCSASDRIQHIFVTLRGIAVHPGTIADKASPDWQELAPQLANQPLQVDLMSDADPGARGSFREGVIISAGVYRQVRLRFAQNHPAADEPFPEKNVCGTAGFNCVVLADGRIQPLVLDGAPPELRVRSQRIEGGFLLVAPDADTEIIIELNPAWSLFSSSHDGVRLVPTLTGNARIGRQSLVEAPALSEPNFTQGDIK